MSMKIAGLVQARMSSERCPRKMLRPFAGTTLIDIALEKFSDVKHARDWDHSSDSDMMGRSFPLYFAANEQALIAKYFKYSLGPEQHFEIILRDEDSARSDDVRVIMNYLDEIPEKWIMFINPCHAFLTLETLEKAVRDFEAKAALSMTSVVRSHTWYYHLDGRPINFLDPTKLDTKVVEPLLQAVHAFHIFNKECFMKYGFFWSHEPRDPELQVIPEVEAIDIDTELDFEVAEALYAKRLLDRA